MGKSTICWWVPELCIFPHTLIVKQEVDLVHTLLVRSSEPQWYL